MDPDADLNSLNGVLGLFLLCTYWKKECLGPKFVPPSARIYGGYPLFFGKNFPLFENTKSSQRRLGILKILVDFYNLSLTLSLTMGRRQKKVVVLDGVHHKWRERGGSSRAGLLPPFDPEAFKAC